LILQNRQKLRNRQKRISRLRGGYAERAVESSARAKS
jgi:hypothetical protein